MAAILGIVERILSILLQVLGLSQLVQQATQRAAQEHVPYAIETIASNGTNTVIHPTHGNAALLAAIQAIGGGGGPTIQDVLDAIAALPAGSALVIPSSADNASAVWMQVDPNSPTGKSYGDEQNGPYLLSIRDGNHQTVRSLEAPFFEAWADINYPIQVANLNSTPTPDWTDIRPDDSRLSWLTRTDTYFQWSQVAGTGSIKGYRPAHGANAVFWWFTLTEAEFAALKPGAFAAAPVWPGLANVTLGTPVALATALTITEPMHGVLIEITAVASKYNSFKFDYDGLTAYRRLGALTFLTDEGDAETYQALSFELAVYTPSRMSEAASVKLECAQGTVGTITPWLRTT